MIYIFAVIGVITVAVLLWQAFGSNTQGRGSGSTTVAPDDDPEFLRSIGKRDDNRDEDG
ncbi:hypothetical protein FHX42_004530 [Saccharopolyspora lacisalsi]|uniref:Uncharacterized protein n=1 Tax=Halosaccharopolyspora lacisalsi TaxID=1000566 RepID=A0A839E3J1_9PSEU|nr:hypothetical protein [Halosaccharopolyspora lacisalsi]MBA8827146.1 hypothetical protein [Halosaccharopolyspora lacisalsi]